MRYYFAGIATYHQEKVYGMFPNRLDIYAYQREAQKASQCVPSGANMLIDSGGFTAFTLGKTISITEYFEWAKRFEAENKLKFNSLRFMTLDVVGNQEKTWQNFAKLRAMGLEVLPIVTHGCSEKDILRALEYDYIAFGGLVPYAMKPDKMLPWLKMAFSKAIEKFRKTGTMPKIHLLGVAQEKLLSAFPAYSSDSSSWTRTLRFGQNNVFDSKLPSAKKCQAALVIAIQDEVRRYIRMQDFLTSLWKRRGISWQD